MDKIYSLALWWWAAKWFIHIWVYKYLQENNINISEISWTSMWAIMASLIAIWKNYQEIIDIAKDISYYKMIDLDLTYWLIKWEKIYKKLEELFWTLEIQNTKIPLRITATNITNWTLKIFTNGKIIDALRASISIPWILSPKIINNISYVDGGMIMNLPIQALSWENIIAVSALETNYEDIQIKKEIFGIPTKSWFFKNNFEILNRSLNILMKTNEDVSLLNIWKNIILIRPKYFDFQALDFDKIDYFIDLWYEQIKKENI